MKYFILIIFLFAANSIQVFAHKPANKSIAGKETKRQSLSRRGTPCDAASKQIDMDVNNVRARLLNGGDCWWDLNKGRYIVPKVEAGSGKKEVSGLFAGAVWVGGLDPANNLHIMAQDYRNSTSNDCWPGPLTPELGETDKADCINWDQFFVVSGKSIREQQKLWKAVGSFRELTQAEIPEDVLLYPARGNKYFSSKYNFELPFLPQGLGLFYEEPNSVSDNNVYEPEKGDFPIIDIRGCNEPVFPDQMFFWIYNDNGGVHTNSNGDPIRMEVQVQAFAFNTGDEINDMTFQRYKLINRAPQDLLGCYFAMWVDPDLGCYIDDYIGCNIDRSLMYIYNRDATDGSNGSNCDQGVETYGTDIPILGVDYFRGPIIPKDTIINGDTTRVYVEGGMSSFMYYNNNIGNPPAGTTDPGTSVEYYNYLRGRWRDGTPLTQHGTGYNPGSVDSTRFAFDGDPNDATPSWSMCSALLPDGDRRTLQATGPMLLTPGAINELIIGVVYVPDQNYPCPDPEELFAADKLAQDLFDNCFKIKDGPDAPDVDIIELDQELILVLTNDVSSNNYNEKYAEAGIGLPSGIDSIYRFEGYRIFQVSDASITINDQTIADPTKAREIFNVDLKNNVSKIYNWIGIKNPSPDPLTHPIIYVPVEKVAGTNQGILHTFKVTEDQFAKGDRRLINHKKYYFVAIAYGYNNFKNFNIVENQGQRMQYCPGRLNIGPNGDGRPYTGIPRPQVYEKLNSKYGNGVEITRHDGIGMGGNDLLLKPNMYDKLLGPSFDGRIDYQSGRGPVQVKIYDPLRVKDGDYELRFEDKDKNDGKLTDPINWLLVNLTTNDTIRSEFPLGRFNEQILNKFGISVVIGQSGEAGGDSTGTCGVIGEGLYYDYKDINGPVWYIAQPDRNIRDVSDFILNSLGQPLHTIDPQECFSNLGAGYINGTWYPFRMTADTANLTPAWIDPLWKAVARAKEGLAELNNVDIVFTKDKSKWSRCLIIETWNPNVGQALTSPVSMVKNFAIKPNPSVTKYDNDGDGKADVDTEEDSTGYGWFPGYVVDVESGKRLNVLFGENSFYSTDNVLTGGCGGDSVLTGNDMMYNPANLPVPEGFPEELNYVFTDPLCPLSGTPFYILLGSHHYIYVTKTPYDSCKSFRARLNSTRISDKNLLFQNFTWCSMSALFPGNIKMSPLTSGPEGLIPNDLTVRLRVDNPYKYAVGTNENKGQNMYSFKVIGEQAVAAVKKEDIEDALEDVNVVPNPYYGFSSYESGQFSNVVKITNLPASCTVTIYSMDGKFIKQYKRDETPIKRTGSNPGALEKQITPDLEWDLTNFKNIPISSGAYIIHIKENNTSAEKIIKWFGVARKFDPSGL